MLEAGLIASRFLHYVAVLSLFGAALFPLYAFRRRLNTIRENEPDLSRWIRRVLILATALALVSGIGWFAFTTGSMAGDISKVADTAVMRAMMTATDFGPLWVARLIVTAIIAVLLTRWPSKLTLWLVPLLAALLLSSLADTGHARTEEGWSGAMRIAADAAHLAAAGGWLGGLLPLGYVVAASMPSGIRGHNDLAIGEILRRFSGVGTIAVAVLVASGLVNSWFLVGSLGALVSSDYGELLLAKVALFLLMAVLAMANRFWITPKLTTAAACSTGSWLDRLRWSVLAEQMLGLLVLAFVSMLGVLQPPILP